MTTETTIRVQTPTAADLAEFAEANSAFENSEPVEIIRWAANKFGEGLVFTSSFEDAVLVHAVAMASPTTEIVLLDTQYLFAETWWFANELKQRFDLNVRVETPLPAVVPDNLWRTDTEGCCALRKVEPLQRALQGKRAWITGIRRVDGPTRANTPIVNYDPIRNVVKINPLATFTDEDLALYVSLNELPANPLTERGYPSIGCWPCTRPVAPGEDKRAGRWSGQAKTECGLHV